MTRIVAVSNQKGGVAKTTTTASLGAALAELGQEVLLVDLDPQACLTFALGIDPEELPVSIHQVLMGQCGAFEAMIDTDDYLDLLPSDIELTAIESHLIARPGREYVLRELLKPVAGDYDWVLLDCSPSLGILTLAALTAATDVLVPMHCETLSHRGLGQLLETIAEVRQYTNPDLTVLGVLPVMFDDSYEHQRAILADVGRTYQVPVLPPVPRSIKFAEAPARGRSILATDPTSAGAAAYRLIARRLLEG